MSWQTQFLERLVSPFVCGSSVCANAAADLQAVVFVGFCWCYWEGSQLHPPENTNSTLPLDSIHNKVNHDHSKFTYQAAWVDFKDIVGKENVSLNEADLKAHSGSDWSTYAPRPDEVPFLIVRPADTQEVSEIMKVCHDRRLPVTPYSGGTSLEGQYTPTLGGVCIDFCRMDRIVKLNKEDMDVIVQPAVGWEVLNEELGQHGLFFPPDPGPGAQIGGMIGTGCSGTNAYRYGTMKDWVLSLTVVLADGTVVKTKQRPRKSSAGYDLTRIFIGSEGTLGLVTEATLKLTVKPLNTSVAVSSFRSIREAADCVQKVVGAGVPIAAIEILDDVQMRCINNAGATSKKWAEAPTLFFKFSGTPAGVKEDIDIVQKLAKKSGSNTFEFARSKDEADTLWSARKEALWSDMAMKRSPSDRVWTTDVAVPISKLPDIIEETKADIDKHGVLGAIVGHVGDGNFHAILLYNEEEYEKVHGVVHRMVKRAIEMEGTATGEHGVGLVKRDYLPYEVGQSTVDLMRQMKKAFDPYCLLNCDKVVRMIKE
ncbi:D-lactate dehydrogenase [Phyllosticta capitalensis]|uniref:D-lactate dehydrogenase n=1 Tax=Phyllosticta capitalensis TaxID=121624 RepID=A0ABR1YFT4_9PEZI